MQETPCSARGHSANQNWNWKMGQIWHESQTNEGNNSFPLVFQNTRDLVVFPPTPPEVEAVIMIPITYLLNSFQFPGMRPHSR